MLNGLSDSARYLSIEIPFVNARCIGALRTDFHYRERHGRKAPKRFGRPKVLDDLRYVAFAHDGNLGLARGAARRLAVGRAIRDLILRRTVFAADADAVDDLQARRRRAGSERLHLTVGLLEVEVHLVRVTQAEHGRAQSAKAGGHQRWFDVAINGAPVHRRAVNRRVESAFDA